MDPNELARRIAALLRRDYPEERALLATHGIPDGDDIIVLLDDPDDHRGRASAWPQYTDELAAACELVYPTRLIVRVVYADRERKRLERFNRGDDYE